jgi:hypothetical protein
MGWAARRYQTRNHQPGGTRLNWQARSARTRSTRIAPTRAFDTRSFGNALRTNTHAFHIALY